MWCVASAPIVPLARDLDAALGTQLSELAVHFRKLSALLLTAPPSRAAPAFLPHTAHATPHCPTPLSGTPAFLPQAVRATPTLRGLVSAPSRTCATSRPAARHSLRAAIAAMGPFFR